MDQIIIEVAVRNAHVHGLGEKLNGRRGLPSKSKGQKEKVHLKRAGPTHNHEPRSIVRSLHCDKDTINPKMSRPFFIGPAVWPSAGVKAAGLLQRLGTPLWVGRAPKGSVGIPA